MANSPFVVETAYGPVKGFADTHPLRNSSSASLTEDGGQQPVLKWLAVPYGQAQRFERPTAPEPWKEPLECFEHKYKFPQPVGASDAFYEAQMGKYFRQFVKNSESCHSLDIYAPEGTNSSDRLPVLVWIYGGALNTGHTSKVLYDPTDFIRAQAKLGRRFIVVAINYRVNAFGFLSSKDLQETDKDGLSGNYGVYDCVRGLEWIQENIESFGGSSDPEHITIWGESAGAWMVSTLLTCGKKLFTQAIADSGAASTMATHPVDKAFPAYNAILKAIGADQLPTAAERVKALKAASMEDILAAHVSNQSFGGIGFSIEEGPNATWDRKVLDKLQAGEYDPWVKAVIQGTNENEGEMFTHLMRLNNSQAFNGYVSNVLGHLKSEIEAKYLKGEAHPESAPVFDAPASRVLHDQLFAAPAYMQAKALASKPNAKTGKLCKVYFYRCRAEIDSVTRGSIKLGSIHTIELPFIFNTRPLVDPAGSHEDRSSILFGELWSRFVIEGVPREDWKSFDAKSASWFVMEDGGETKTESLEGYEEDFLDFAGQKKAELKNE